MSYSRIYQAVPLKVQTAIRLDEKASHHVGRVLRAKVGDYLILFNGQGGEYEAQITRMDKKNVEVDISRFIAREAESPLDICLMQGMARGEKMDFIVQKAVELGVKKIIPLITERCNVRLEGEREEKRLAHWQSVIISACEQSGRNRIPEMVMPLTLKAGLASLKADACFVLSPYASSKLSSLTLPVRASVAVLIGPEGGLSEQEVVMAEKHGFLLLNVGPRVLRTETAAIAAMTLLQGHYGDMA
ncbi:MAG: 16S rRNA (uracil(1498)-N(3))-methyltransferase [Gammaproteobacteria bacterium]|nr:MAG: 16S rRNA (uracil(1498)-N(3))-methyltransferase [Gammaproteobacteria bacterium]